MKESQIKSRVEYITLLRTTWQRTQYCFIFETALFFCSLVVYVTVLNNIALLITQSHLSVAQASSSFL